VLTASLISVIKVHSQTHISLHCLFRVPRGVPIYSPSFNDHSLCLSTHWWPDSVDTGRWKLWLTSTHQCSTITGWIEQCFTFPPTQFWLYGRRFLQVKKPNQQYQSTECTYSTQRNQRYNNQTI